MVIGVARTDFEKLEVYQLAERLADLTWRIASHWDQMAKATLGGQLIRAADSVGANIAEGCGRGSYGDNRRFAKIARGSLYETKHWLRRAYSRDLLDAGQIEQLRSIIDELAPRLNAYIRSIGRAACNPKTDTTDN